MNPETKRALRERIKEITASIERLDRVLLSATEKYTNAKASKEQLENQIEELKERRKKIREDIE